MLIVFCSNDNPVLILAYFTRRSNVATSSTFYMGKCDNDGNLLEIIASCDLEFGLLCKLND